MIRRFSNDAWQRRETSFHSPELKAWIAEVLREAARRPDGVGERNSPAATWKPPTARVFRETDNDAECRSLPGHGTIFVPKCYEEKYPYPLIVWLNDSQRTPPEFQKFLAGISDRNYLGFAPDSALTAEIIGAVRDNAQAGRTSTPEALTRLHDAVKAIRHDLHLHTERVILTGVGQGAIAALELFLARPEWFGGAVLLDGLFPDETLPIRSLSELRGKRVFLANSPDANRQSNPLSRMVATGRLLNSAGLSVTTRAYDSPDTLAQGKLADINEWVMEGVCAAV